MPSSQFCNNGVYRTGFILAAFLVYMGQFDSMGAALAFFSRKRLEGHINADVAASAGGGAGDDGGEGGAPAAAAASYDPSMSIYHRMMPTWRFLAGQLDRAFREPASLPKAYRLEHIIIHAPGLKRLSDDNDPVVQILEVSHTCELAHSSRVQLQSGCHTVQPCQFSQRVAYPSS